MIRAREISHTDWTQYWIDVVYLKPVDLQQYPNLAHCNQLNPVIDQPFW